MDDFFYYFSKIVIIFPIVIVIFALILKFNQNYSQTNSLKQKKYIPQTTITISPKISSSSATITNTQEKLSFDLDKNWLCQFKDNGIFYQVLIKNKTIKLTITENNQKKEVDLTMYYPFIKNFLDTKSVSQINSYLQGYSDKSFKVEEMINYCQEIKN